MLQFDILSAASDRRSCDSLAVKTVISNEVTALHIIKIVSVIDDHVIVSGLKELDFLSR
jgi:hypothetical protein